MYTIHKNISSSLVGSLWTSQENKNYTIQAWFVGREVGFT
jgi:hypothetical protein